MAAKTEPNNLADVLVWEQERGYSRQEITIVSGQSVVMGQAIGKVTASGKYAAFDQDLSTGVETAVGFAIADYDATSADTQGVMIARDAIIVTDNLTWPSDITEGETTTALATLAGLGIIAREES
ncbi:MAG: head decoration protein [Deltaproteobacteria bacterium]|nr:MAG: head decoration protein [Deltaproteobacteria bacterium]